jgi:hypothetical protein
MCIYAYIFIVFAYIYIFIYAPPPYLYIYVYTLELQWEPWEPGAPLREPVWGILRSPWRAAQRCSNKLIRPRLIRPRGSAVCKGAPQLGAPLGSHPSLGKGAPQLGAPCKSGGSGGRVELVGSRRRTNSQSLCCRQVRAAVLPRPCVRAEQQKKRRPPSWEPSLACPGGHLGLRGERRSNRLAAVELPGAALPAPSVSAGKKAICRTGPPLCSGGAAKKGGSPVGSPLHTAPPLCAGGAAKKRGLPGHPFFGLPQRPPGPLGQITDNLLRSNADIFEVGFLVMLVQTHVVSCRTLQPRPCVWTGLQKQKGGSHVDPVVNPLACPRGHLGLWGKRLHIAMNFCFFWYCVKRSDGHFNV